MNLSIINRYWFYDIENSNTIIKYSNKWFDHSIDEYIKTNFPLSFIDTISSQFNTISLNDISIENKIALIIIFDQLPRNIFLLNDPKRTQYDNLAIKIVDNIIQSNEDINLPIAMKFFTILPYRHQKKSDFLDKAIKRIKLYYQLIDQEDRPYLDKFYQHTLLNYTNLIDTIYQIDGYNNINILDHLPIFDEKVKKYYQKINNIFSFNVINSIVYQELNKFIETIQNKNLIVSLSGGIDSMVILHCLKYMQNIGKINKLFAIHIFYGNNPSTNEVEKNFLIEWCKYLNIPLYGRDVYWMKRIDIDRNIYEEETRKVRFNVYKYCIAENDVYGVCLGHHRDDISENVFTNIIKGRDILDLKAMKKEMIIDGVKILRPLLDICKDKIYDYAETFYIPYFLDSTPDWSCRGIMRRQVFPLIDEHFGPVYQRLYDLGETLDQWKNVIDEYVINPINESLKYYQFNEVYTGVSMIKHKILPKSFYTNFILKITRTIKYPMFKHSIIDQFYNWLSIDRTNIFIQYSGKKIMGVKQNDTIYLILIDNINKLVNELPKKEPLNNIKKITVSDLLNFNYQCTIKEQSKLIRMLF
jgi:tRNA(Ile)-lysidine synthetase-like protein